MRTLELLVLLACASRAAAQFFQFQQQGGGINLEDLMGGGGGGGGGGFFGGGGGEEVAPPEEEDEEVDLYERLELEPEATDRDVKKAFRTMSVKYHPDKNPGADVQKFREISEAYEILSDKEKRVLYDHGGMSAVKKAKEGGGGGGGSPFDMFFGGQQQQQGGAGQRGRNMDIELPVTLEDLYVGNEKAATVKRRIVCRNCKNKGHLPRCANCGSCPKEKKMVHRNAGRGMIVQQEVVVESKEKCKREEKTLRATIEKGMPDSEEIVFKYESEQKPGQIPGDVVLKLKTVPHPMYKRSRDNLSMKLAIPLRAALLGFETTFKHLDGHTVTLKRTSVTKPNQVLRIKGEGMPKHGTPSEFGDLSITFTVEFPAQVDEALSKGLEALLPAFTAADMKIG